MDWVIVVIQLVVLVMLLRIAAQLRDVKDRLRVISTKVDEQKARQSQITARRASSSTPQVDAKARTTKRDTDDLPLTGRMSMGVHRKKRDYDGNADDNRLQQGTGAPTAHVGEHPGWPEEGRTSEDS